MTLATHSPATAEAIRARFLRDRVMTATPAQRVVMLYDRLVVDLRLSIDADDDLDASPHLSHAMLVIAELQSSLDASAGGAAENLARIYNYLLRELIDARGGRRDALPRVATIVGELRDTWAEAVLRLSAGAADGS
jgi:flagellar protein FliS